MHIYTYPSPTFYRCITVLRVCVTSHFVTIFWRQSLRETQPIPRDRSSPLVQTRGGCISFGATEGHEVFCFHVALINRAYQVAWVGLVTCKVVFARAPIIGLCFYVWVKKRLTLGSSPVICIGIANLVWCIACKRELGGEVVYCPIVVQWYCTRVGTAGRRGRWKDARFVHKSLEVKQYLVKANRSSPQRQTQGLASVALLTGGSRAEAPREQLSLSPLSGTPAIIYRLRRRHSYL